MTNPERPVQLIIAGKAHPEDRAGQALIHEWINFIRQPQTRPNIVFLSDYDMLLTEQLVQGGRVWISTLRRPREASGTSGMKVLVNGGINLSALDLRVSGYRRCPNAHCRMGLRFSGIV